MRSRLNLPKFQTLKEDLTFWALHRVLDIGSTQISLKGVEFIGQRIALLKSTQQRHFLKFIHTLNYAHQLDLLDLRNRLDHLNRQRTALKDQLNQLNILLSDLSLECDQECN